MLLSWLQNGPSRKTRRSGKRASLFVESLDERCVPSATPLMELAEQAVPAGNEPLVLQAEPQAEGNCEAAPVQETPPQETGDRLPLVGRVGSPRVEAVSRSEERRVGKER